MAIVLLIEPDIKLADTYAAALRLAGHRICFAPTAQAAILQADANRPDVVLLELQLVAHGGIEFLYEFRSYADWQAIPVAVVSHVPLAEFATSQGVLYGQLGVKAYYYKPQLSLAELLAVVSKLAAAAKSASAAT